jgi:hypothetical protein
MNFERQFMDEMDKLMGGVGLVVRQTILILEDSSNSPADYIWMWAWEESESNKPYEVGWQFFIKAFEGDEKSFWNYMYSSEDREFGLLLLSKVFKGDSAKVLAFLRRYMEEEEIRSFIHGSSSDYGIKYEPI